MKDVIKITLFFIVLANCGNLFAKKAEKKLKNQKFVDDLVSKLSSVDNNKRFSVLTLGGFEMEKRFDRRSAMVLYEKALSLPKMQHQSRVIVYTRIIDSCYETNNRKKAKKYIAELERYLKKYPKEKDSYIKKGKKLNVYHDIEIYKNWANLNPI